MIDRYRNSILVKYLASIPHELIDEQFGEDYGTEKWMRFFGDDNSRVEIDIDRALKNDHGANVEDFIRDEYGQFSDRQLLRALNIMFRGEHLRDPFNQDVNLRSELEDIILGKILNHDFDFRHGNLLTMFAESFLISLDMNIKDCGLADEPLGMLKQQMHPSNPIYLKQIPNIRLQYSKLVASLNLMIPFYRHFFTYYKMNKKMVVIELLARTRVHDPNLFNKFIQGLKRALKSEIERSPRNASWTRYEGNDSWSRQQRLLRLT